MTTAQARWLAIWGFIAAGLVFLVVELAAAIWLPGMPTLSRLLLDAETGSPGHVISLAVTGATCFVLGHLFWPQHRPSISQQGAIRRAQAWLEPMTETRARAALAELRKALP